MLGSQNFIFESQPPTGNLGLHLSVMVPQNDGSYKKKTAIFSAGVFVTKDAALAKAMLEDERCYKYRRYKIRSVSKEPTEAEKKAAREREDRAQKEAQERALKLAALQTAEAKADEKARKEALKVIEGLPELEDESAGKPEPDAGKQDGGKPGKEDPKK